LLKYRKIHLPGSHEVRPNQKHQQLEKHYFRYGDLGFPAVRAPRDWGEAVMGMLICNDRRWPEAWRVLALQNVELVCIGYNSAAYDPSGGESETAAIRSFFYQRLESPAARQLRAKEFRAQFTGLTLADFYKHDYYARQDPGANADKVAAIKPPAVDAAGKPDLDASLRGIRKNLVLLDFFVYNRRFEPFFERSRRKE